MDLFAGAGSVGTIANQSQTFCGIFPHFVLEDLAGGIHGEAVHKGDVLGYLVAGDALLAFAYQVAAGSPRNAAEIVAVLGEKGVGVVEGQVEDLGLVSDGSIDCDKADFVYRHKTADLFVAAAVTGGLAAGAGADEIAALEEFALNLGLAFQYEDDLLDGDGAYPREKTAELVDVCTARAVAALKRLSGDVSKLSELAVGLVGRKV